MHFVVGLADIAETSLGTNCYMMVNLLGLFLARVYIVQTMNLELCVLYVPYANLFRPVVVKSQAECKIFLLFCVILVLNQILLFLSEVVDSMLFFIMEELHTIYMKQSLENSYFIQPAKFKGL